MGKWAILPQLLVQKRPVSYPENNWTTFLEKSVTIDYCNDWLYMISVCCKNLYTGGPPISEQFLKNIKHFIFGSIILYNSGSILLPEKESLDTHLRTVVSIQLILYAD